MKIVSVIPIIRGLGADTLTYFTLQDVAPGEIVTVPLRNKKINALVTEIMDLAQAKSLIKTSDFSLKKIEAVRGKLNLSEHFIETILLTKEYFATETGAVFHSILPKNFWLNYETINTRSVEVGSINAPANKLLTEKMLLQLSPEERISFYKTFIRESFAKKKSVLICVPRAEDTAIFANYLQKGIKEYVLTFHNNLSAKEFDKRYHKLIEETHPMLILTTPNYLFTAPGNLSAIILERESSSAYKQIIRPFIDFRIFAETLASKLRIKIIFADTLLRVETLGRLEQLEATEILPISYRVGRENKKLLIDLEKKAISLELLEEIKKISKQGERSFLFTLRKGFAPITFCGDCARVLYCHSCERPVTLHEKISGERTFLCHFCRAYLAAKTRCKNCNSWNLRPWGVGTETVVHELEQTIPKSKIFRLDKEIAKTPKQAKKIIEKFYSTHGAILVGTELALHHLTRQVELAAVVSFDSLWSIPDFRLGEKITHLLLELNDLASSKLIIQTKNKNDYALKYFMSGNLAEFAREELANRQKFGYPPYTIFIKITFSGSEDSLINAENIMRSVTQGYNPVIYKGHIPKVRNQYILNALIRPLKDKWVDLELANRLRHLPPSFTVQINPESLL